MDQISIFLGGRINDYAGALIQGTFDGIGSAFFLDNSDLRLIIPLTVHDTELRLGLDINNGPTVQDPYNSTYAWGYPFATYALVPTPTAQPLLADGLIGNSVGATLYAWYDRALYLEAGLYNTYGPSLLSWTGNAYGPGSTANPAPYLRAAYEWNWNGQSAHIGSIFLHSNINPAYAPFSSTGSLGHDSYTVTDASATPSQHGYDLTKLREHWAARVSRWKMPTLMPCISTGTKAINIAG